MKKFFLYISLFFNVVFVVLALLHWRYIGMKYNVMYTPPLACDRLKFSYIQNHANILNVSDEAFNRSQKGASLSSEQAKAFRQSVFVQDTAEEIEKLCNKDIGDFTGENN